VYWWMKLILQVRYCLAMRKITKELCLYVSICATSDEHNARKMIFFGGMIQIWNFGSVFGIIEFLKFACHPFFWKNTTFQKLHLFPSSGERIGRYLLSWNLLEEVIITGSTSVQLWTETDPFSEMLLYSSRIPERINEECRLLGCGAM
jgi:hypothetical protein